MEWQVNIWKVCHAFKDRPCRGVTHPIGSVMIAQFCSFCYICVAYKTVLLYSTVNVTIFVFMSCWLLFINSLGKMTIYYMLLPSYLHVFSSPLWQTRAESLQSLIWRGWLWDVPFLMHYQGHSKSTCMHQTFELNPGCVNRFGYWYHGPI